MGGANTSCSCTKSATSGSPCSLDWRQRWLPARRRLPASRCSAISPRFFLSSRRRSQCRVSLPPLLRSLPVRWEKFSASNLGARRGSFDSNRHDDRGGHHGRQLSRDGSAVDGRSVASRPLSAPRRESGG